MGTPVSHIQYKLVSGPLRAVHTISSQRKSTFISFNNLANTHYAAIVVPGYQAAGKQLSVMQLGDGFGVFVGASLGFD